MQTHPKGTFADKRIQLNIIGYIRDPTD
jgi:hypothetical protein